jgi:hypothetical protein
MALDWLDHGAGVPRRNASLGSHVNSSSSLVGFTMRRVYAPLRGRATRERTVRVGVGGGSFHWALARAGVAAEHPLR